MINGNPLARISSANKLRSDPRFFISSKPFRARHLTGIDLTMTSKTDLLCVNLILRRACGQAGVLSHQT